MPAPALVWRSSRRSWSITAAGCGSIRRREKAAGSSSPCRSSNGVTRMHEGSAASVCEVLLVEDNPADARLTQEAMREGRMLSRLHHVKDGVEALQFLRREGP